MIIKLSLQTFEQRKEKKEEVHTFEQRQSVSVPFRFVGFRSVACI